MAWVSALASSSVYPSAAARAACAAPMVPAAPALFSTTTGVDMRSDSRCAITRPAESVTPPAGQGTTILIGLFGYPCAQASAEAKHNTAAKNLVFNEPLARRRAIIR